jgi:hypothetical protein
VVRKTGATAVNRIRPFALGSRLLVWLAVPNHKRSLSFRGQLTANDPEQTVEALESDIHRITRQHESRRSIFSGATVASPAALKQERSLGAGWCGSAAGQNRPTQPQEIDLRERQSTHPVRAARRR